MKAFVVLVCLVAVVTVQALTTTKKPPTTLPPVDCDISSGGEDWALLVPNPKDCNSYYVCGTGTPILMPCPAGLHFNPRLAVCDWPWAANCTAGKHGNNFLPN